MRHILAALLSLLTVQVQAGYNDPMTFFSATNGGNCSTCGWIVAEGVIEADTHTRFREFLEREGLLEARGLRVHLNSPGGDLMGALQLGILFRQQEMNTAVSAAKVEEIYDGGLRVVGESRNADCSSACVFAFAGGVSRYASHRTPGSAIGFQSLGRLGVHQFYDPISLVDPTANILDAQDRIADQQFVSLLLNYLSNMDVSAELLQLAAQTDPRGMHYLTESELRSTRIDTGSNTQAELVGYSNGIAVAEVRYRRGDGTFKVELLCEDSALHLLASIDWRGSYDAEGHQRWGLMENISLRDGGRLVLLESSFFERGDGGTSGSFRFRFADPIDSLVERRRFLFEDWSSRYANDSAVSLSFILPDDFNGLHVLPQTCL